MIVEIFGWNKLFNYLCIFVFIIIVTSKAFPNLYFSILFDIRLGVNVSICRLDCGG